MVMASSHQPHASQHAKGSETGIPASILSDKQTICYSLVYAETWEGSRKLGCSRRTTPPSCTRFRWKMGMAWSAFLA